MMGATISRARATTDALVPVSICLLLGAACARPPGESGKTRIAHPPTGSSLHLLEEPPLACGLEKGAVRCVSPDGIATRFEVDEPIVALAGSVYHLCALGLSGAVRCAGQVYAPPALAEEAARSSFHAPLAIPLPGPARSLIASSHRTCAVHATGRVTCWSPMELSTYPATAHARMGRLAPFMGPEPPQRRQHPSAGSGREEAFLQHVSLLDIVAAHDALEFCCAVEAHGAVHCYRWSGLPIPPSRTLQLTPLSLYCTWAGCCARGTTGALECWAAEREVAAVLPLATATFAFGADTLCFTTRRAEGGCHRVMCMATPWIQPDDPSTYLASVEPPAPGSPFYGLGPAPISLCIDLPRTGPNA